MLRLIPGVQNARAGALQGRPRTRSECVTFGGIAFELLSRAPLQHDLIGADQRYLQPGADPRAIADVTCAVHVDAPDDRTEPRWAAITLENDANAGVVRVQAGSIQVELSRSSAGRYAVSARIPTRPDALVGMLRAIAGAVLHFEGGLMIHAAGIEFEGRAALFVGPSGAGKSTAAQLSDGARCFAYDHVALAPSPDGVVAWGLPGGNTAQVPLAAATAYPLAAILRVRKSPRNSLPQLQTLRGAEALFAVRESVECADLSLGGEDVYLHAATKLSEQARIGTIATVLGRPHGSMLRAWLRGEHAAADEEQPT